MKKLAIVTCLWRRPILTALFLDWTAQMAKKCNGFEVDLIAVGSEDEVSAVPAVTAGWYYFEHPNEPLSAKWQFGIAAALSRGADAVLILGSDDFTTVEVIRAAAKVMFEEQADVFGIADFRFIATGPRAAWFPGYGENTGRVGEPMGAGRCFSRRLLVDILKGVLWPKPLPKGLDGAAWERIQHAAEFFDVKVVTMPTMATGGMIFDCKRDGEEHVCQFQSYLDTGSEEVDAAPILGRFPGWLVKGLDLDPRAAYEARNAKVFEAGEPRLELVMIAKNSGRTIGRAIASAMPIIDAATVLLDADSDEDTGDVAVDFGVRTETQPWAGFGPQREAAHALAKGKFHLVLDADEVLEINDLPAALKYAEENDDVDAILCRIIAFSRPGANVPQTQARVLRAGRTHWAYRRHNEVIGIKNSIVCQAVIRNSYVGRLPAIAEASIVDLLDMYHNPSDPFVSHEEEKAHACLHLARSYSMQHGFEEAVKWAQRCREHAVESHLRYAYSVMVEAWATLFLSGQDAMEAFAHEWLKKLPAFAELHYLVGSTHMTKWYASALRPGRYGLIAQQSLMHTARFPQAAELMGFPVRVTLG